ncbi:MAG TPA: 2,3-butanediol dehydrogenase [Modestobacter sp.]|jgi:(R,R)-butanediol dehydrogenase/meso-butanediol dehydrogenase/diacetyl reductase|nr:2,3-butanediol dehydrogenase [Modestobacter sp.]
MKAALFYGPKDIRIEDVPEPQAGPGQVKVRVEWCGICGTDLHEYLDGPIFCPPAGAPHPLTGEEVPVALGHEFAGVVADIGDGVTNVAVGDRVVVEPYLTCGTCARCREGRYNICDVLGFIGLSGGGGGFSEYVVADARRTFPIGDLGTDIGALVEPLAVAYHAVRLGGVRPGMTATVFGAGPIGLVTTAALRAAGAAEIVVVEPADVRKEKASAAGATTVLDPTDTDVVAAVKELTGGRGTDVSFECAGFDAALAQAVQCTRGGGTVVNVAIWGHAATVAMNDLVFNEVSVVGSLAYCDDHEATIELLRDGRVQAEQFITGRIALDDIVDAGFRELIENKDKNVKILVHP